MSSSRETRDIPTGNEKKSEIWRELDRKASKEWARGKIDLLSSRMTGVETTVKEIKDFSKSAKKSANEAKTDAGNARIESLDAKKISERTKKAFEEANMSKHECIKTDTLTRMKLEISDWTKWWRRSMFTLVGAVIIFGGALVTWLYLHKVLSDDVESMQGDVSELKEGMSRVEAKQKVLGNQKPLTRGDVETALKDAMEDMEKEDEKKKGRKGRRL